MRAKLRRWLRDADSYGEDADERFATAHGLRQLADLIEDHPEAEMPYSIVVYDALYDSDHEKAIAHLRGKAKLFGGKWTKEPSDGTFYLKRLLGGKVEYWLGAPRQAVCEKRVIGTRSVQRPVPRYDTPEMETVTEEVVEWDCPTILA